MMNTINNSLDINPAEFKILLEKTTEFIVRQYEKVEGQNGFNAPEQKILEAWFNESLPQTGQEFNDLLAEVQAKVIDTATGNMGPNMYAYVMSGGNQVSSLAELIMSTVNQNNTRWHLAPAMTEIEKRVISWTSEMIGFIPEAGGAMVSGGSEGTLAGLTVARNVFFKENDIKANGMFGMKPFTVYCSTETHSSTDKSIVMLGIGTNNLRKIKINTDFTIDINALENQILQDIKNGFQPFCIIGNAGTVNTGAIDDLDALADLASKYKTWYHIDGAYGGLVAALDHMKPLYKGIERADSVALDFHKWLYQPFEIGCVLVRNWSVLRETYYKHADYLDSTQAANSSKLEYNEHYFQLSRNAKAFKVWLSVKAYGFEKIKAMIQKDLDLTAYLTSKISDDSEFLLYTSEPLAICCFQYVGNLKSPEDIETINKILIPALEADGRVFITSTKLNGKTVLRACIINHRKNEGSIDYLLEVIKDVAQKLIKNNLL